ncbi:MAG: HAMP domain-containing sensor histidine kinase [Syntrophotaleaceae bacterium]
MPTSEPLTFFAPADRVPFETLRQQIEFFADASLTRKLLDAVPSLLMILNRHRQIVYANQTLVDLIASGDKNLVHGLRPGEALNCLHAAAAPGGCGTAEACSTCGAVLAVLGGLQGRQEVRECRVTRMVNGQQECLDLQVWATPLIHSGETFTVLAISDISHQKRRRVLERLFFHDILNVVGSIRGFAELLQSYRSEDREAIYGLIKVAAEQTIDEIETQRILSAAENNELQLRPEPIRIDQFLHQTVEIYRRHPIAEGRIVSIIRPTPELTLFSDRTLLGRVLGNMLKNALEACCPGETVTTGYRVVDGRLEFRVNNPGVIPPEVQLQIFQRSFSTKGEGRGLGTYSLRLLSSRLGGEVSFISRAEEGTTFLASYPLKAAV